MNGAVSVSSVESKGREVMLFARKEATQQGGSTVKQKKRWYGRKRQTLRGLCCVVLYYLTGPHVLQRNEDVDETPG